MDSTAALGAADELQLVHLQRCITAQQALLAKLRDSGTKQQAVQQLRSLAADFTSTLDSLETTFRLLDLPRELRNAIYKLCIGHGKIFLPNSFEYDVRYRDRKDYDDPQWQLLATNKQIRAEAIETLFIHNQIFLSDAEQQKLLWVPEWKLNPKDQATDPAPQLSLSNYSRKLLTSISVALDSRGHVTDLSDCVNRARYSTRNKSERRDAMKHAHDYAIWNNTWQMNLVVSIMSSPKLRHLELDMAHSYCTLGCCSCIETAGGAIVRFGLDDLQSLPALESIDIAGLKTKAEQQRVIHFFGHGYPCLGLIDRDGDHKDCKGAVRNKAGHAITMCLKGFDSRAHYQNGGKDFRYMLPERVDWIVPERTFVFVQS